MVTTEQQPTTGATPERFSKHETWGLYWVAWWMGQQEDKRQLGGTLTLALQTIREMIGPIPKGYDPLEEAPAAAVPDAETTRSILALWAFADDRDVDGTTKHAQDRVRRYLESLPEEMQP